MATGHGTHGLDETFHAGSAGLNGHAVSGEGDQVLWQELLAATTLEASYHAWLALQCHMIAGVAEGVVVLETPPEGRFQPVAFWPQTPAGRTQLAEAAEQALREQRPVILHTTAGSASGEPSQEPCHIAYPIQMDHHVHGIVALALAPRSDREVHAALRQLQWGAAWPEVFAHRQQTMTHTPSSASLQAALDLVATVVDHPRFQAAAMAFVTAFATHLRCDRVSVGFVHHARMRVQAISHMVHFGKKTNLTRALESAMDEAYDQAATVLSPAPPAAPFRITHAHEAYAHQHGTGPLCSVPLSRDGHVIGVLTLEQPAVQPFSQSTIALCEAVAAVVGPMLEVQRRDDRWLVTKAVEAWHTQCARLLGPRHVLRKLVTLGLMALVMFVAVARADYRVAATAVLEPVLKRVLLAPFEGYIAEAPVRAGDLAQDGQVLARLDDRDLRLERLKWRGQREQHAKQYQQALALHNTAQMQIVTAQIAQAEAELARVEESLERTQVRTPFAGIVVTGDLSQSIGAPVERGQVLFEMAPLEAYRVILEVDERDIAEVAVAQQGHLVLTAFPHTPLPFTVEKITPVSTAREGRNYFRVETHLHDTPARLRPGMEGIGKITIERRLLLWIWTHQALDWLRLQLWSWWP
jgi:multidrug resistance efflux pump